MTTLDDCRLKAVRAEKHLHEISAEFTAWRQRDPYEFAFETNPKDPEEVSIRLRMHEHPPAHLGAVLGDFLNNCRSVVDYIATRLDLEAGGKGNNVYFPAYTSRTRFHNYVTNHLSHFDPNHLALIEGLQPFNGTRRPFQRHPGAVLMSLNRLDKHHAITPTIAAPYEFKIFMSVDDRVYTRTAKSQIRGGKIEDGTEIAKARWPPWPRRTPRPRKMEMHPTISFEIVFGRYTYADATWPVLTWVRDDVLARFEPILVRFG